MIPLRRNMILFCKMTLHLMTCKKAQWSVVYKFDVITVINYHNKTAIPVHTRTWLSALMLNRPAQYQRYATAGLFNFSRVVHILSKIWSACGQHAIKHTEGITSNYTYSYACVSSIHHVQLYPFGATSLHGPGPPPSRGFLDHTTTHHSR